MSAELTTPTLLHLRDCGRVLSIHRSSTTGSYAVTVYSKGRGGTLGRAMAYAAGKALELRVDATGACALWMRPASEVCAAFDLNGREAEQVSQWAGIPMPEAKATA